MIAHDRSMRKRHCYQGLGGIAGQSGDPYEQLLRAKETSIHLVMINGIARYGTPDLMQQLSPDGEALRVGGQDRMVFLQQATEDPDVAAIDLGEAQDTLTEALQDLPTLAKALEQAPTAAQTIMGQALDRAAPLVWSLALDEIQPTGVDLRPHLPFGRAGTITGPQRVMAKASTPPLSTVVEPLPLDAMTVADDTEFLERIRQERNLPAAIQQGLPTLY